jgi:hypothetical protein
MQTPTFLQGERPIDFVKGALAGAVATLIVGFYWGGWTLGSTAKEMAQKSATTAVVAVLAPICVDKFQRASDAAANLIELKKISTWQQSSYIEKGGWATLPGSDKADSAVASACASMLGNLK